MPAEPLHISTTALDEEAFALGALAMRLERGGRTVKRQQRELAGVLDAGHRFNAILMPRRSTKTSSLFVTELGRCLANEDHHVAYTAATTGKAARDRFNREVVPMIERAGDLGVSFRVRRAAGMERIEFGNGSLFQILAPTGDDFRGQEFNDVVIDEAQDAEPEAGDDLLAAILPVMDTNPEAQLILAGTAGPRRDGNVLWDQLERGRAGDGGILEYAARGSLSVEDYETWEQVEKLLLEAHPGIPELTSLGIMRTNFERIRDRAKFAAEYLGVWGTQGSALGVFDPGAWTAGALSVRQLPAPPARFALAFAASPNQGSGSIVAAWRDGSQAHILLIDHRLGTSWLAPRLAELSRKFRVPVSFDNFGVNLVEVEKMKRMRPSPRLAPQNTRESSTAAAQLVEEVKDGHVHHYEQGPLTASILLAQRRAIGAKAYAYGRGDLQDDISAAEAASIALFVYDQMPVRQNVTILRPSA